MQYIKYLSYVIRHKWFVMIECFKVGLYWRGIIHDMSKFYPGEFIPYAKYFYGTWIKNDQCHGDIGGRISYKDTEMGVEEVFNIAWLKHQHRNDHHWQYWILRLDDGGTTIFNMPHKAMKEMICDWKGAGQAINRTNSPDECREWFIKNRFNMTFADETREKLWKEFDYYIRESDIRPLYEAASKRKIRKKELAARKEEIVFAFSNGLLVRDV